MPTSKSFRETCRLLSANDPATTCFINLEGEDLHGPPLALLSRSLAGNSIATRLCLRHCYVHDDDVAALVPALRCSGRIDTLDLRDNFVGPTGAASLASLLRSPRGAGLKRLRLESNGVGDEGCRSLSDALRRNWSLLFLNLTDADVGPDGAAALADGLRHNRGLESLNLSRNVRMGSEGAEILAAAYLKGRQGWCANYHGDRYPGLVHLDLSDTGVGDDGAAAIADAMKTNGALSDLDLSRNGLTSAGASSIANALEINCTLRCVRLGGNSAIRDDGASNVAFALFRNEVLERLDCDGCGIGSVGASCLAIALQKNYALRRLDLEDNAPDMRPEVQDFIEEAVRRNDADADPTKSGVGGSVVVSPGWAKKREAFKLTRERAEDGLPGPLKKRLLFVLWIANKIDAGRITREEKPVGVDIWWTVLGMLCGSDLVPARRRGRRGVDEPCDGVSRAENLSAAFDAWLYPCGSRLEEFVGQSARGSSNA